MGCLLYITDRWPFHPGESFLGNEIRDLAPHFEKILLLPLAENIDEDRDIRNVPENVVVLSELRNNIWKKWSDMGVISRFIKGFVNPFVIINECLKSKPFNPRDVIGEAAQVRLICNYIENEIDITEIGACASFWLNRGAFVCAELKRRNPHIVAFSRGHGGDIYSERRGMRHFPLQHNALKRLDRVLPDSTAGVDYLSAKFPLLKEKIVVGRLGVDNFEMAAGSSDGVLRILSVSSLVPVKRVHLIPQSLQLTNRKIVWTHIGGGECLNNVEKEIEGLGENVEVNLLGQLAHNDVLNYYSKNPIDLFINVSSSEGLPVSIMEAFANGVPVIATSVGGSPEIVGNDSGFLLDENFNPDELATILEKYSTDSENMRVSAWNKQRKEYSSEKNQERFAKDIIRMIKNK
tara:strand:- start:1907 stop:3124 length:1218 start_codon:yes stop_codon:yes gene_type:complete